MKRGTPIDARFPHKLLQKEIGAWYGISPQAVRAWDCPRNKDGTYDARAVSAWRDQRIEREAAKGAPAASTGEATAKQRSAEADADMKELDLHERRGDLVLREDVDQQIRLMLTRIVNGFRALAARAAPKLANLGAVELRVGLEHELQGECKLVSQMYDDKNEEDE